MERQGRVEPDWRLFVELRLLMICAPGLLGSLLVAIGCQEAVPSTVTAERTQNAQRRGSDRAGCQGKQDFRAATSAKRRPKAAVDGAGGMILAFSDVTGTPQQAFMALMTDEVERWWRLPGVYHLKDWKADLRVQGHWSVTILLEGGKEVYEWGEVCELDAPKRIVMTRRFGGHPSIGERETTLSCRFEPSPHGTLVTLREEGFIGRSEAAYGNAENWEKVLGWLDEYLSQK